MALAGEPGSGIIAQAGSIFGWARVLPKLVVLAIGLACAVPSAAQGVKFTSVLWLQQGYTDNVSYVDTDTSGMSERSSDYDTLVGVSLDFERSTRKTRQTLRYRFDYRRYDRNSDLDDDSSQLDFSAGFRVARGWLTFQPIYDKTQQQVRSQTVEDQDLFLSERTVRELYGGALSYRRDRGRRWSWGLRTRVLASRFKDIPDEAISTTLEDRDTYEAYVDVNRVATRRTSLRMEYSFQRYELSVSGNEEVHTGTVGIGYSFTDRFGMDFSLGVLRRTDDMPMSPGSTSETKPVGNVNFRFNEDLTLGSIKFRFAAGLSPSAGGALLGTSTNFVAYVEASGLRSAPWSWTVTPRYTRRSSTADLGAVTVVAVRGNVQRAVTRKLSLNLYTAWSEQQSDNDTVYSSGSFYQAGFGLAWYPAGREKVLFR